MKKKFYAVLVDKQLDNRTIRTTREGALDSIRYTSSGCDLASTALRMLRRDGSFTLKSKREETTVEVLAIDLEWT